MFLDEIRSGTVATRLTIMQISEKVNNSFIDIIQCLI